MAARTLVVQGVLVEEITTLIRGPFPGWDSILALQAAGQWRLFGKRQARRRLAALPARGDRIEKFLSDLVPTTACQPSNLRRARTVRPRFRSHCIRRPYLCGCDERWRQPCHFSGRSTRLAFRRRDTRTLCPGPNDRIPCQLGSSTKHSIAAWQPQPACARR